MVIDHALGPPRGAGGVVEREALPFILGHDPLEIRIARGQKILVFHVRPMRGHPGLFVGHLHKGGRRAFHPADRVLDHAKELRSTSNTFASPWSRI
jgi:hypothetical protein